MNVWVWVVVNTKTQKILSVEASEKEAGETCHYCSSELITKEDTPQQIIDKCMTFMYDGPFELDIEEVKEIE